MIVKYIADVRTLTGSDQEHSSSGSRTVRALLRELAERHGHAFEARVFENGGLSSTLNVLVNGRGIEALGGLDAPVGADDLVTMFPVMAGG